GQLGKDQQLHPLTGRALNVFEMMVEVGGDVAQLGVDLGQAQGESGHPLVTVSVVGAPVLGAPVSGSVEEGSASEARGETGAGGAPRATRTAQAAVATSSTSAAPATSARKPPT